MHITREGIMAKKQNETENTNKSATKSDGINLDEKPNSRELLSMLLRDFSNLKYVHPNDIPSIDLYMDQVTTFLEEQLSTVKRNPEDKTVTKTMINNYAKDKILPAPEKKKYSKDHLLVIILIYYFKSFLPMKDVADILNPVTDKYFNNEDLSFADIYDELVKLQAGQARELTKDVIQKWHRCQETFEDAPEDEQQFLKDFGFICMLGFDVFVKKAIIEDYLDIMGKYYNNDKE